ncbi:hypothetical protein BJV82DRAFT_632279 [Fennellomyces sp. T-0311]|nr:hypothetical protein BJV82DRAFT_632279 [Fennellomyces sp. T-0311]
MPSAVVSSQQSKTFKWAPQRVKTGRVHKRTGSASSPRSVSSKKPASTPTNEIARLESEITFTYDAFATVSVMFDSLQHAYASSKAEMDKSRNETRLSEKEKELLAAYDDLGLQVVHLERQVVKLEKRLAELRSTTPVPEAVPEEATPALEMPSPTLSLHLSHSSTEYYSENSDACFYPSPPVQAAPLVNDPTLFCDYSMIQPPQQYIYPSFDNMFIPTTTSPYYYQSAWPMQQPVQF